MISTFYIHLSYFFKTKIPPLSPPSILVKWCCIKWMLLFLQSVRLQFHIYQIHLAAPSSFDVKGGFEIHICYLVSAHILWVCRWSFKITGYWWGRGEKHLLKLTGWKFLSLRRRKRGWGRNMVLPNCFQNQGNLLLIGAFLFIYGMRGIRILCSKIVVWISETLHVNCVWHGTWYTVVRGSWYITGLG